MSVVIGSRKSHLAQVQAYKVDAALKKKHDQLKTELYFRPSFGDLNLDMDLSKTDQKGVFTQDFLELLESGGCDLVVHSWKDLPIEETANTKIAATLEREDSRDLFLVKKSSQKKQKWNVLTSSPRREFNLKSFFSHLSNDQQHITFSPIRGNIPTRFEKFLNDESADGFCVALAAVKRLKNFNDFNSENPGLWKKLDEACSWCVLPESFCPSAAAQGALAVEVKRSNKDVLTQVESVSDPLVFDAVTKERKILKGYGGGCHLAVGATVLPHSLGELTFTAGEIKSEQFRSSSFKPKKAYPPKIAFSKLWISSVEVQNTRSQIDEVTFKDSKKALVASKFDGASHLLEKITSKDVLYTSGLASWKKFFSKGVWVNGTLDQLGAENFESDVLADGFEKIWLTRSGLSGPKGFKTVHTYELKTSVDPASFEGKDYFVWTSGELFKNCLKDHPQLKTKCHFIGMGRSQEALKDQNASDVEVWPYYTVEQLTKDLTL